MKRQSDEKGLTSRVFVYGTVPERAAPVRGEEAAFAQMRLAGRLWNLLVVIERARVAHYRAIMHDPEQDRIDTLKAQMETIREEMNVRRQKARKRNVDLTDLREALAIAKREMVSLIEHRKETKDQRHEERRGELTANQELTDRRIKRARQAASSMGLFWGTYNDIVQRADTARKLGGELQFRSFRGQGTLTAQIMGGAKAGLCVGGAHTFFQIDAPSPGRRWRYARMRIGSTVKRDPIWLEIPVVYHRQIPETANIRSVSMTRRLLAGKPKWQLNVTVNLPQAKPKQGPAIAVDIGWRLMPEGVRVAYWEDDLDQHGQVLVSAGDIGQVKKVAELRSNCDRQREEWLPALASWLDTQELSEEWRAQTAFLLQWRSCDRLAALVRWWADHRISGDEEPYEAMREYRKQYLHLSTWWRNLQDQMTLRIREQYRVFAAGVAKRYGTVVIEDFDLREVAEIPEPEAVEGRPRSPYRQTASPSALRGALLNVCRREGLTLVKLPAAFTTRQCNVCGYLGEWDSAADVLHRCEKCGELWDQDRNAAINLLRSWQESSKEIGVPA